MELVDEDAGAARGVAAGGETVDRARGAAGTMYMCDTVELPTEIVWSLAGAGAACREVAGGYIAFTKADCGRRKYVDRGWSIKILWSNVGEGEACRVARGVWRLIEAVCGGVGDAARAVAGDVAGEPADACCSVEVVGVLIDTCSFGGSSKRDIIGEDLGVVREWDVVELVPVRVVVRSWS